MNSRVNAMRYLAIGDIHGCSQAFDQLLAVVQPQPEDIIITLGDYLNTANAFPKSSPPQNTVENVKK